MTIASMSHLRRHLIVYVVIIGCLTLGIVELLQAARFKAHFAKMKPPVTQESVDTLMAAARASHLKKSPAIAMLNLLFAGLLVVYISKGSVSPVAEGKLTGRSEGVG